ncbi:uncharacterized protein [Fopius arisanus]|uniref:Twk-7_0 protein n=1 Tax=Fopius arisanus TaxID=64838 RepID=A0A0C9QHJ2_9HYME|nr:PREDICTED: uncharacterized protein LOC105268290 isoform X1 [Fopius arisanus]
MDLTDIDGDAEQPSKCIAFLRMTWKFCKCIFSHVTLVSTVVAYCVLGAYAFEKIEAGHEKDVKISIKNLRVNITERLWDWTLKSEALYESSWKNKTILVLQDFEKELLTKMKKEGWDGNESTESLQWTFAGALFYSIIVITTIGYGHIAPKTPKGKIVTIFYAILGIPLMLLCLSNIGDIMASSFRFLYWKVCCYICVRPPKPRRARSGTLSRGYSVRQGSGRGGWNRGASLRRSIRTSQRSADSALGLSDSMTRSTDNDYRGYQLSRRFEGDGNSNESKSYGQRSTLPKTASPRNLNVTGTSRYPYDYRCASVTPRIGSRSGRLTGGAIAGTTQSLDRRLLVGSSDVDRTPVLFNKYAIDEPEFNESRMTRNKRDLLDDFESTKRNSRRSDRATTDYATLPRSSGSGLPRRARSVHPGALGQEPGVYLEMAKPRKIPPLNNRRPRSNLGYIPRPQRREAPSPRIMSPMGFAVHRQIYVDDIEFDDYSATVEDQAIKPVPIWLCVFLVVSYILAGAVLFMSWEHWEFLDSAYFCFITLTTIGFGDFVPAHKLPNYPAHMGIALCSLYLLFGIALLAMSFNLVQEEVITNVKTVAKRLGIIKDKENEDDEEDPDDENVDIEESYEDGNYECEYHVYPPTVRGRQCYVDEVDQGHDYETA